MVTKKKKLEGKAVKYYEDGLTVRSELNYSAGLLEGLQKRYYKPKHPLRQRQKPWPAQPRRDCTRPFTTVDALIIYITINSLIQFPVLRIRNLSRKLSG